MDAVDQNTLSKGEKMNRDFLKGLGLEKDVINEIMKAHGLVMQETRKAQDGTGSVADIEQLEQQLAVLQWQIGNQTVDDIASDNARLKQEIESYKLDDLKREVAIEHKLPIGFSKYLVGSTERELHEDAQRMASFSKRLPIGYTPSNSKDADLKNLLRRLND